MILTMAHSSDIFILICSIYLFYSCRKSDDNHLFDVYDKYILEINKEKYFE